MAKHSTGAQNNKVAGSFIATIVAIVAVVGLVAWWFVSTRNDDSQNQAQECIQGELSFKVMAFNEDIAQSLIQAYNKANPVVRDYCVTAEYTNKIGEAAALITTSSDGSTNSFLASNDRSAATLEWPVVATSPLGVAAQGDFSWDQPDITYASEGNSLATALVASALNDGNQDAVARVLRESADKTVKQAAESSAPAIAVSELGVPADYTFKPLPEDKKVGLPLRVVALNPTDSVSEDQTRAAADFATSAESDAESPFTTPIGVAAAEALAQSEGASPKPSAKGEDAAPSPSAPAESTSTQEESTSTSAGLATTLFLLDTSDAMGQIIGDTTFYRAAANAISDAAPRIGAEHNVGLWNYSSPLNPGVMQGWRANVGLDDQTGGQTAAGVVQGFGTGGQPQTLSALSAALEQAAAVSTPQAPVRVVAIYSGAVDQWDIAPALAQAKDSGVILDVIKIGDANVPQVEEAAKTLGGSVQHAADPASVKGAIDKASAL